MAIRDAYQIQLLSGKDYTVSVTKQGGKVALDDKDKEFFKLSELTKGGVTVREVRVSRSSVEAIVYVPGK